MCIEYRSLYACQCVAKTPMGLQSCNHRKLIENYDNDSTPETEALMRYFEERCKSESTISYIKRTDKCMRCKRVKHEGRGIAKAEE